MEEKVVNVYEFKLENGKESYIYSSNKQSDSLRFNYYILTRDENDEPIVYDAGNTIKTLQNNKINLIPIEKENKKYKVFLSELLSALNNIEKKKATLNRK